MKLKNYEIEGFVKFIFALKLSGKSSRMRTRLIRILEDKYVLFQKERQQIATLYAKKNEDGSPATVTEGESLIYVLDDKESAEKEIDELVNEDAIIEENEENKEMLLSVRDSILNYEEELSGQDASFYDRYCEIVEDIKYE